MLFSGNMKLPDRVNRKPTPLKDFPLKDLLIDPRIVPVGLPDKDGEIPLAVRGVKGLPLIEADQGSWSSIYCSQHAFVSLVRSWQDGLRKGSLRTLFTPTMIIQTLEDDHYAIGGQARVITTTTISDHEPYATVSQGLQGKRGFFSCPYEGFEAAYDKLGRLESVRVDAEGSLCDRTIGSIKLSSEAGRWALVVDQVKDAKYWREDYIRLGTIDDAEIRIPFSRFTERLRSIPLWAVFPRQRTRRAEISRAYLNRPMLDKKSLVRCQYSILSR